MVFELIYPKLIDIIVKNSINKNLINDIMQTHAIIGK